MAESSRGAAETGRAVQDRVRRIVSQVFAIPIEAIDGGTSPETVEAWDSLKHMNLVLALEQEFGIHFTDDRIVAMLCVSLIEDAVWELVRPAGDAVQR